MIFLPMLGTTLLASSFLPLGLQRKADEKASRRNQRHFLQDLGIALEESDLARWNSDCALEQRVDGGPFRPSLFCCFLMG